MDSHLDRGAPRRGPGNAVGGDGRGDNGERRRVPWDGQKYQSAFPACACAIRPGKRIKPKIGAEARIPLPRECRVVVLPKGSVKRLSRAGLPLDRERGRLPYPPLMSFSWGPG